MNKTKANMRQAKKSEGQYKSGKGSRIFRKRSRKEMKEK